MVWALLVVSAARLAAPHLVGRAIALTGIGRPLAFHLGSPLASFSRSLRTVACVCWNKCAGHRVDRVGDGNITRPSRTSAPQACGRLARFDGTRPDTHPVYDGHIRRRSMHGLPTYRTLLATLRTGLPRRFRSPPFRCGWQARCYMRTPPLYGSRHSSQIPQPSSSMADMAEPFVSMDR
jgi:hypothetical protein